jgi:hypothetical protein
VRDTKGGQQRYVGPSSTLLWVAPFLAGAVLRLWNLPAQVMSDDELHAVRTALGEPMRQILTTYRLVDNSIPLTALFRLLLDTGLHLTELTFRIPSLFCGLAILVLFPLWADRRLGRGTAIAFAWLLALSPALVWYSRIARSYAPVVLLAGAAAVAFESWWRRPRPVMGAAYVLLAALAAWFHLGAAPMVAAVPFLFAAGDLLVHRDRRRDLPRWRALLLLGLATTAAFLAFLLPARESLLLLISDKHSDLHLSLPLAANIAKLQAGTGHPALTALLWLLAAAGLALLARSPRPGDRRLAAYTATLTAGHLAGILMLAPVGHQYPLILNRYLLVTLPAVLLWVATALARVPLRLPAAATDLERAPVLPRDPARPGAPPGALRLALAAAFLALLAAAGPFADPALRASPLAHHDDYMAFYAPRARPGLRQVARGYRWLAAAPAPGAVLEYPWMPMWRANRAFYLFQEVHGREVVVAAPRRLLWDGRLAFRNMAPGDPQGFLASRARFLVVHRDLGSEEDAIPDVFQPARPDIVARHKQVFRRFGKATGDRLRSEWGPPDHADRRVRVWDLDRVRRQRAASERAAPETRPIITPP